MLLKSVMRALTGAAAAIAAALALAQAPVEVSFYYPVAVGGPITKIIDGLAADFEKENPGIKLKPIYSGSYQESITKALTAVKGGDPPVTSILLSTDMFTLIDEDAIVPVRRSHQDTRRPGVAQSFYPAFMENSQTGGKTWGIPFQRSTIVLYYNKEMFKEAGLDPNRPPANWKEQVEYAQKLTKRDASGKVTQWGMQIPSSGFPYWLFQALAIQAGTNLMNSAGTQTYYDRPEVIEGLTYWVDLVKQVQGASGGHRRVGHDAEGLLRAQGRDDVDDHRQPHQRARPTRSSTSASRCCPRASSAAARPAAATSICSRSRRRRSATRRSSSSSGSRRRSARRSGGSTRAMSRCAPTRGRRRR